MQFATDVFKLYQMELPEKKKKRKVIRCECKYYTYVSYVSTYVSTAASPGVVFRSHLKENKKKIIKNVIFIVDRIKSFL